MEEENMNNWLEEENKEIEANTFNGERLESLHFEEDKITSFVVDFSRPFEKWIDPTDNIVKKIIPVVHNGERKNLWLNVKNPLYAQMVKKALCGINMFKVIRTGKNKDTKFTLIEE